MKAYQLLLLLLLLFSQGAWAQMTVRGTIHNQRGETIPGVNIYIKGTYTGTSSELDGTYELVMEGNEGFVLIFQALGFRTQEIPVQQGQVTLELSITLKDASTK